MNNLILITGASGNLGYEIFKSFKKKYSVVGTYYKNKIKFLHKLDLTNFYRTKVFLNKTKPNIVIHLSAFTNPALNQKFKEKSKKLNLIATKNLINSLSKNTKFIFFSTDKVYSYKKNKNIYDENSMCKSKFVYARNKIKCEKMIKKKFNNHIILRLPIVHSKEIKKNFSFLDSCIVNIKRKKKVTIFNDVYRSFVDIVDLIKLLKTLIRSKKIGTFNIGSKPFSYSKRLLYICKKLKIKINGLLKPIPSEVSDKYIALSTKKLNNKFKFKFY